MDMPSPGEGRDEMIALCEAEKRDEPGFMANGEEFAYGPAPGSLAAATVQGRKGEDNKTSDAKETTWGCGGACLPWLPFAAACKTSGSS
jgi:hypothetical protein